MVKRLSAMQETQVQSLGQGDPLEKEKAAHSSFLAWKIPWTEEPGGLQSMGVATSRTRLSDFTSLHIVNVSNIYRIFIGYIQYRLLDVYVRYLWLIYFMYSSLYNSLSFHFLQGEHFLNSWVKRDLSVASGKGSDIFRKALLVYFAFSP